MSFSKVEFSLIMSTLHNSVYYNRPYSSSLHLFILETVLPTSSLINYIIIIRSLDVELCVWK